jgi:hypothetical protein
MNVVCLYPTVPPAPKAARPGSEKLQYSVECVLIEGTPAYAAALAAQNEAIRERWGAQPPANLKLAIKDPAAPSTTRADGGPARRGEVYENLDGRGKRWYLRAATTFDLQAINGPNKTALLPEHLYSGGVWTLGVKFAAYTAPVGGCGVTAYLALAWRTAPGKRIATSETISIDEINTSEILFSPDDSGAEDFNS